MCHSSVPLTSQSKSGIILSLAPLLPPFQPILMPLSLVLHFVCAILALAVVQVFVVLAHVHLPRPLFRSGLEVSSS
jgi:hypothetical protein